MWKYLLLIYVVATSVGNVLGSDITFLGNTKPVIESMPDKSTGIDCIYVVNDLSDVAISFNSSSPKDVTWFKYSNLGGGYAQEITGINIDGNKSVLTNPEGSLGYIIESPEGRFTFWLVDYSDYESNISSISPSADQECDITWIQVEGSSPYIYYYTINGRQEILSRDYILEYDNLEWNADNKVFNQYKETRQLTNVNERTPISPAILCSTYFILSADRFQREWGDKSYIESDLFHPIAVEVYTDADQMSTGDEDIPSNQINSNNPGLGGSAPAVIDFYAYVSDAVIHYEWQMATDEEFEDVTYRINQQDFNFTFTEEGTTYVRFIGSNSDGSCEAYGDVYTISIGASELLIPNVFSPDGDGVNDEWKVSYRSLIDFKCWIFDRNGHEIIHFEDPSQGWDGKRNGKAVKSGVYFYVIQATGADGKKYKKSGDINILIPNSSRSSMNNAD